MVSIVSLYYILADFWNKKSWILNNFSENKKNKMISIIRIVASYSVVSIPLQYLRDEKGSTRYCHNMASNIITYGTISVRFALSTYLQINRRGDVIKVQSIKEGIDVERSG